MSERFLFRVGQLNVNREHMVMSEMEDEMRRRGLHMAAIQEPPWVRGRIVGFGSTARILYRADGTGARPLACVVVADGAVDALFHSELSSPRVVVATVRRGSCSVVVVSVYIPPGEDVGGTLDELDGVMRWRRAQGVLIIGDFNSWHTLWGSNSCNERGRRLVDWMQCWSLELLNQTEQGPTFSNHNGSSSIDLSLATPLLAARVGQWRNEFATTSVHSLISFGIAEGGVGASPPAGRFSTRSGDWRAFKSELRHWMVDYQMADHLEQTVDEHEEALTHPILMAATNTLPSSLARRQPRRAWWSPEIDKQRQVVIRSRRIRQRARGERRELMTRIAREEKKKYKYMVRRSKRGTWVGFVEENLTKDPWSLPYRVVMEKLTPQTALADYSDGNHRAGSIEEAALMFLKKVFPKDDHRRDTPAEIATREDVLRPPATPPFLGWTLGQLRDGLKLFNRRKAPGEDGIDFAMLCEAPTPFLESLLALYNHALKDRTFPEKWKRAKIRAILKSPDRDPALMGSLRPLSLLSCMGKLLERLILLVLDPYLSGAAHPSQYGCTRGRSTEDAICRLLTGIHQAREKWVLAVFFDIAGAFNSLWWPMIMARLKSLEIPSDVYGLIGSYFSGRSAELCSGSRMPRVSVTMGCPQGSVLGPALWNLVFAGLLAELDQHECSAVAYVDDLAIVVGGRTRQELVDRAEGVSRVVAEWCQKARLEVSSSKTQAIMYKGSSDRRHPFRFKVGDDQITATSTVKYLGVQLSRTHSCSPHLDVVTAKVARMASAFRSLAGSDWGAPFSCQVRYYASVFLPSAMYGAPTWWRNPTKAQREHVLRMQRSVLIAITKAYRTCSTIALQVLAGAMPLDLVLDARVAYVATTNPSRVCVPLRPELAAILEGRNQDCPAAIATWAMEEWQRRWTESDKGRLTYQFFPDVARRLEQDWISPTYCTTQLLTGHGNFSAKLCFFRRRRHSLCPCRGQDEYAEHILRDCPIYNEQRRQLAGETTYAADLKNLVVDREQFGRFRDFATSWHRQRGEGPDLVEELG